jgi:hypothetical protein
LDGIVDNKEKEHRLTELNVIEQVRNLAKTPIVQQAWVERELHLHGWVYGMENGLIKDLSVIHNCQEDIDEIFRFAPKSIELPKKANQEATKKLVTSILNGAVPKVAQQYTSVKKAAPKKAVPKKTVSSNKKKQAR